MQTHTWRDSVTSQCKQEKWKDKDLTERDKKWVQEMIQTPSQFRKFNLISGHVNSYSGLRCITLLNLEGWVPWGPHSRMPAQFKWPPKQNRKSQGLSSNTCKANRADQRNPNWSSL